MAIISACDYSFRYSGEKNCAIENINFEINKGEIILIAGDSGSGKSTFLKSLNGLIPEIVEGELSGKRLIKDKDMLEIPIYDISRVIGSVFQNPRSQFFTLKTTDELVFPMENYGFSREDMEKNLKEVKDFFGIENLMDRDIHTLSSGERQLLAIASATILSPDILLFDEPSANLDYANAMNLKKIITKLKKEGKTILVADHRFFYLNNIIDRVFLIENHNLKIFESEEDFKNSDYNTRSFDLFSLKTEFREKSDRNREILSLENVSWLNILKDISLKLYDKEIATIVGSNGAGKTSLAKVLTGTSKIDSGVCNINDMPFYVMQDADFQLFGTSVFDELDIGNEDLSNEDKEEVLKNLNIEKYKDTHPFDLSGGEKQRLQIAMACLSKAELIIFDEPTSGLDSASMQRVVKEIENLAKEKSILIISHDYEFIRKISQRIIYLNDGKIEDDFYLEEESLFRLNNIFKKMEEKYE